jgi:ribosomal protein L19E
VEKRVEKSDSLQNCRKLVEAPVVWKKKKKSYGPGKRTREDNRGAKHTGHIQGSYVGVVPCCWFSQHVILSLLKPLLHGG